MMAQAKIGNRCAIGIDPGGNNNTFRIIRLSAEKRHLMRFYLSTSANGWV